MLSTDWQRRRLERYMCVCVNVCVNCVLMCMCTCVNVFVLCSV